jgi:NAD(P)-dependent dehydrogenase (short-subunit alcohol dehydrogenase family)
MRGDGLRTYDGAVALLTGGGSGLGAALGRALALSRALRLEAQAHGVRVSVLCPGVIRTPILESGGRYGRLRAFLRRSSTCSLTLPRLREIRARIARARTTTSRG